MKTLRAFRRGAGILVLVIAPAAAVAGLSVQGLSVQGLSVQGLSVQGLSVQGLSVQGLSVQGLSVQGLSVQGLSVQGLSVQGLSVQGLSVQGVSPMGTDLGASDPKGVAMDYVTLRGTTAISRPERHELTAVPGMSTGRGNYISVRGGSAVGHYAVGHLVDAAGAPAEDLDLYIAGEQRDPAPNLFHRPEEQDNQDQLYVVFAFHKWSGQWMSLCPYNPATESASAIAMPEDPAHPNRFFFACTATGVASKCARGWGYRPWARTTAWTWDGSAWGYDRFALKPFYDVCTFAAMAAYCQDGTSFTKNGTLVDLFDSRQIIWPNALENPWNAANDDSRWMFAQEYLVSFARNPFKPRMHASGLQRTRYRELSPAGECSGFAYVDRLERDRLEDAHWSDPAHDPPRLQVSSPTYCSHHEDVQGAALPWDCSPCTTTVCRTMPQCCSSSSSSSSGWNHFCVQEAKQVCKDASGPWPTGKVWPTELPPDTGPARKYLTGPQGAVLRVEPEPQAETPSAPTPAAVQGWACDPEWPGAVVSVQVWDGPREKPASRKLGEARAELPLAVPLAREVSAACDGPGRDHARHGFAYRLPSGHRGNVFVYALDEATDDGPAAPPTLIRNGIVAVPPPPAPPVRATISTGWIEAPVDGSYLFDSSQQPSRLWVNGQKLLDWFPPAGGGAKQGSVTLLGGVRYPLRWDRFQTAAPPPGAAGPAWTWRTPGSSVAAPIPTELLYQLAPGSGRGLRATYYERPDFSGRAVTRVDEVVDLGTRIVPPSPIHVPDGMSATSFSAVWEGEVVPTYSDSYTFIVVGSGTATLTVDGHQLPEPPASTRVGGPTCAHDLCELGDKLSATTGTVKACDPCVDKVCARDPYCCNGGYLSYYSSEPVWDAKCIAEVGEVCGLTCKKPIPNPVSPQRRSDPIPMRAGVHYTLRLTVSNMTSNTTKDDTVRLLWSSTRQHKDVVPAYALWPAGQPPLRRGAGLNVTLFGQARAKATKALKSSYGEPLPDLDHPPIAAGATPEPALTDAASPLGVPPVVVLAAPGDSTAITPPPPLFVRPWWGEVVTTAGPELEVHGIGGLAGGSIRVVVHGDAGDAAALGPVLAETLIAVGADGRFKAAVATGGFGPRVLEMVQRTFPGKACPEGAACGESRPVRWHVTVQDAASPAAAPVIFTPHDPTSGGGPGANVFMVTGQGTSAPVTVTDQGGPGAAVLASSITARPDGTFRGTVTLSTGEADPVKGWHKLVFSQGASPSKPVFVGVGIRPPTVTSPRHGAPIDCSPNAPDARQVTVTGRVPYAAFGSLVVAEEVGRGELAVLPAQVKIDPTALPDGGFPFQANVTLGYGRHLLHVFQAPDAAPNGPARDRQAQLRAFASLADGPTTRFAVQVPPPPIDVVPGASLVLTAGGPARKLHLEAEGCGPPPSPPVPETGCGAGCGSCAPPPPPTVPREPRGCALPYADVNLRIGQRVYTTRADEYGYWSLDAEVFRGWNDAELTQVVATEGGSGWAESCPSSRAAVGVVTVAAGPALELPKDVTVPATSAKGAEVAFVAKGDRGAVVTCSPASGSTFPVGQTSVGCSAVDPASGAVRLGRFAVTVVPVKLDSTKQPPPAAR